MHSKRSLGIEKHVLRRGFIMFPQKTMKKAEKRSNLHPVEIHFWHSLCWKKFTPQNTAGN